MPASRSLTDTNWRRALAAEVAALLREVERVDEAWLKILDAMGRGEVVTMTPRVPENQLSPLVQRWRKSGR